MIKNAMTNVQNFTHTTLAAQVTRKMSTVASMRGESDVGESRNAGSPRR